MNAIKLGSMGVVGAMLTVCVSVAWGDGPAVKSVIATGKAAGTSLLAKDEALQDAKRKAVEQACGLFIDSSTSVENFEVVRDRIMQQAKGYVTRYTVKDEWEDGGISHCKIIAYIKMERLKYDWEAAFVQLKEDTDNPRVMIVISQDNDPTDDIPPRLNATVQAKLEKYFLDKDVRLIRQDILESVRERDLDLAELLGDTNKIAGRAANFGAELLVYGEARAIPMGGSSIGGRVVYRWNIEMSLSIVKTDSAAMLVSDTYKLPTPHMQTGPVCNEEGFVKLIDNNAGRILKSVYDAWKKKATSHRTIVLVMEGCTYAEFVKKIQPAFAKMRGVKGGVDGVKHRETVNATHHTIELYWKFDLDLLANKLILMEVDDLTFDVTEKSGNRLTLKVNHGG